MGGPETVDEKDKKQPLVNWTVNPGFGARWWFKYKMTNYGFNPAGPDAIGFITLPFAGTPQRTMLKNQFPFNKLRFGRLYKTIRKLPLDQTLNTWGHTSLIIRSDGKLYALGHHPRLFSRPWNFLKLKTVSSGKEAVSARITSDLNMFTSRDATSIEWAVKPKVVKEILAKANAASKQPVKYTAKPAVRNGAAKNCVEFAISQGANPQVVIRATRVGNNTTFEVVPGKVPLKDIPRVFLQPVADLKGPIKGPGEVQPGDLLLARNSNQSTTIKTFEAAAKGDIKIVLTDSSGTVIAENQPTAGRLSPRYLRMKVWGGRAMLAIGLAGIGYETYTAKTGTKSRAFTRASVGFGGTVATFPRVYQARPGMGVADIVVNCVDLSLNLVGAPEHHTDLSHTAASLTPSSTVSAGFRNIVDITWRATSEGWEGVRQHSEETVREGLPVLQGMAMLGELYLPKHKRQIQKMRKKDIEQGKHGIFVRAGSWWADQIINDPIAFQTYIEITKDLAKKQDDAVESFERLHQPMKHDLEYYHKKFPNMRQE